MQPQFRRRGSFGGFGGDQQQQLSRLPGDGNPIAQALTAGTNIGKLLQNIGVGQVSDARDKFANTVNGLSTDERANFDVAAAAKANPHLDATDFQAILDAENTKQKDINRQEVSDNSARLNFQDQQKTRADAVIAEQDAGIANPILAQIQGFSTRDEQTAKYKELVASGAIDRLSAAGKVTLNQKVKNMGNTLFSQNAKDEQIINNRVNAANIKAAGIKGASLVSQEHVDNIKNSNADIMSKFAEKNGLGFDDEGNITFPRGTTEEQVHAYDTELKSLGIKNTADLTAINKEFINSPSFLKLTEPQKRDATANLQSAFERSTGLRDKELAAYTNDMVEGTARIERNNEFAANKLQSAILRNQSKLENTTTRAAVTLESISDTVRELVPDGSFFGGLGGSELITRAQTDIADPQIEPWMVEAAIRINAETPEEATIGTDPTVAIKGYEATLDALKKASGNDKAINAIILEAKKGILNIANNKAGQVKQLSHRLNGQYGLLTPGERVLSRLENGVTQIDGTTSAAFLNKSREEKSREFADVSEDAKTSDAADVANFNKAVKEGNTDIPGFGSGNTATGAANERAFFAPGGGLEQEIARFSFKAKDASASDAPFDPASIIQSRENRASGGAINRELFAQEQGGNVNTFVSREDLDASGGGTAESVNKLSPKDKAIYDKAISNRQAEANSVGGRIRGAIGSVGDSVSSAVSLSGDARGAVANAVFDSVVDLGASALKNFMKGRDANVRKQAIFALKDALNDATTIDEIVAAQKKLDIAKTENAKISLKKANN